MTANERELLTAIIDELATIRDNADDKATYVKGRTRAGTRIRINKVMQDLEALVDEPTATATK